jgi:endonuclease III
MSIHKQAYRRARMIRVEAWDGYSLGQTLKPSFVRPLFEERGGVYVKIAGRGKGAKMWQEGKWVVCEDCGLEELMYWSGAWLRRETVRAMAGTLAEVHRELGLAVSPYDRHLVFIAVFLSRATSWETNVLRWSRKIFKADSIEDLLKLDFALFGSSFQLRQLNRVFREYVEEVYPLNDPWEARWALLRLGGVGPKTADAYLLFAGLDPSATPIDRHAVRMARRLGIDGGAPVKSLCARYTCDECPRRNTCLRARLRGKYGGAAGWVQTAFYLHSTMYCSKNKCYECTLSGVCLDFKRGK